MCQISEVQIKVVKPRDGLIGFASLVLDNQLYLSSIGIYTKLDGSGIRLTFPTKKVGENDLNIFHPITSELNREILSAIEGKAKQVFRDEVI
jgi:stage V sporulation protein G